MALVCDYKSEEIAKDGEAEQNNEDLEDGEIEDDEEEDEQRAVEPEQQHQMLQQQQQQQQPPQAERTEMSKSPEGKGLQQQVQLLDDKLLHAGKKRHEKKHLTEAEKSVMRLHKIERQEREKREKYRREQVLHTPMEPEEDFATSLEKAIAKVLKKDKPASEDEGKEETAVPTPEKEPKKGKKRKRKDKHNKKNKKCKPDMGLEEFDDADMLNMRGGSVERDRTSPPLGGSPKTEEDIESESSANESTEGVTRKEKRKHGKRFNRERKFRDKNKEKAREKEKRAKTAGKRNVGVCLYYLQGLCTDDECPYSHETVQPIKLELCKFYLLECCAKGDKCLYMHSDFPCKFYHTGLPCPFAEGCKFAHGGPLSEGLKQILFKHIETAPKEILGNFPRLSRENASVMIAQAQKNLEGKYGPVKKDGTDHGKSNEMHYDAGYQNICESQLHDDNKKENKRNRPSRWQDPEPQDIGGFGMKGNFKDQDMRISSNGDVDMRTMGQPIIHTTSIVNPNILVQHPPPMMCPPPVLPPNMLLPNLLSQTPPNLLPTLLHSGISPLLTPTLLAQSGMLQQPPPMLPPPPIDQNVVNNATNVVDIEKYKMEAAGMSKGGGDDGKMDEMSKGDTDIRMLDFGPKDTDIRQLTRPIRTDDDDDENESGLQIVMDDENKSEDKAASYIETLPKTQRDLYKRILSQQKEKGAEEEQPPEPDNENDQNIDWYSDDEDDNKLTIKDDFFDDAKPEDEPKEAEPAPIKPLEVMEKLGDLSKIDISAEVTKLLTTMSQQPLGFSSPNSDGKNESSRQEVRDPRLSTESRDPRQSERRIADPRKKRGDSTEDRSVSIYDQGSLTDTDLRKNLIADNELRAGGRPDVDLRQLNMPFKAMQNYTPATEIDASINSHPPLTWKVYIVEIPKPDYTGLKLSATDAQTTGDPRLRKIFRLSTEEKDSPASPKESPKATSAPTVRVDPRRKKAEAEQKPPQDTSTMTYTQQMSMLQSSPFYKSLTSNQKVMLNQELASRNDQSGMSDPIITAMLQNLGLISQANQNQGGHSQALNILATTMGAPPNFGQGILGAPPTLPPNIPANLNTMPPNIPNIPADFPPMNFDPRNGGMIPPGGPQFPNFLPPPQEPSGFGGFNDDFYPEQGNNFNGNSGGGGNNNNNNRENNRGFRERNRRGRQNHRNSRFYFKRQHNRNRNNNSPP